MKKNKNKKNIKTYESFKLNLKHEIEYHIQCYMV